MKLNAIPKIDNEAGDFVVLVDYGSEGLSVDSQHKELEKAIEALTKNNCGSPMGIFRLVEVGISQENA